MTTFTVDAWWWWPIIGILVGAGWAIGSALVAGVASAVLKRQP